MHGNDELFSILNIARTKSLKQKVQDFSQSIHENKKFGYTVPLCQFKIESSRNSQKQSYNTLHV